MKKKHILFLFLLGIVTVYGLKAANTDKWGIGGDGLYNAKDMVHVDSSWNLRLFNGDIVLGDNVLPPTTDAQSATLGGYYGIKVPFFNSSSSSTAEGSVILASTTYTTSAYGTMAAILATTTVLGVSDGVYAANTTGYMVIAGYALVLTTGAVSPGDILVSTAGSLGTGAVGYAGKTTGTQVVGTGIGKAITKGTAAGGTVLAIINLQ